MYNQHKKYFPQFFVAVIICANVLTVRAQTAFKYKMKAGEKLKYRSVRDVDQLQGNPGGEFKIVISIHSLVTLDAEQVNSTGITYTTSFDKCAMHVRAPAAGINDTDITLTPLLGKRTRKTMTRSGRTLSSAIVDKPDIRDQLQHVLAPNADGMMNVIEEFNSSPVQRGESWNLIERETTPQGTNGAIDNVTTLNCTYTRNVDTLNHKCAVISCKIAQDIKGDVKDGNTDIKIAGTGKGKGTIWFDVEKGVLVADDSKVTINRTVTNDVETNKEEIQLHDSKTLLP